MPVQSSYVGNLGLDRLWSSLEAEAEYPGFLTRRLASAPDRDVLVFWEGGKHGRRGLSIKAAGAVEYVAARLPDVYGLDTAVSASGPGRSELRIAESRGAVSSVFETLIEDVVRTLADDVSSEALAAVCRRLDLWKQFFTVSRDGLSLNQQAGLFAELTVLIDVMCAAVGEESAARAWYGPEGALQDFADDRLGVEVKSVSSTGPAMVTIANERQLDDGLVGELLLAVYKIDIREAGEGQTLPGKIEDVRAHLAGHESASALFEAKLIRSGYSDAHWAKYGHRMTVRSAAWFRVAGSFPRITEQELPAGVSHVSYKVNVESCQEWALDPEAAIETIRRAHEL
jgi:hypothetical protein